MSSQSAGARRGNGGHGRLGTILSGLAVAVGCVLFLGGFAWGAVEYQPYTVPTDSMQPTVNPGDRVLAQRIDGSEVHRGDVVVFEDPTWGNIPMVKRVVGVGGDKVACCDKQGRLTINGTPVEEPYLHTTGPASPVGFTATVPAGQLFMMGDNRPVSDDSRAHMTDGDHGAVPRSDVQARVDAIAWPFSRVGTMQRPASFAALPGGVSQPGPVVLVVSAVSAGAVLIIAGAAYGPLARRRSLRGNRRRVPATV
ncbi:signal peptidase I [Streptomyces sp. RB6PN25]|uniref:Signal peptidase I n=1 Tax=Streptomyces humicola TaxID=2953240 RepID=A0ABT1Q2L8_9ACTN|nr:signal peptidase I [Streptomyces humicola]MCQ4084176.1 signal peptidase I [Streptomyces humicola]